jgi:L-ascorbate metabolism protein UlaG (beta-lactamase superfamily)
MKITYYGHSAFNITTETGTRIIIDPYESGAFNGTLSYGKISAEADIVITSHNHADHSYTKDIQGKFSLISRQDTVDINGVKIKTITTYHDNSGGKERGHNLVSVINADNLVLAHLGDLGHSLNYGTLQEMGKVDILLIPIGGVFTIDAALAVKIMNDIKPGITIPMHYKTAKCTFPIGQVEDFTKGQNNVRLLQESAIIINKETLPRERQIIVLQHAL